MNDDIEQLNETFAAHEHLAPNAVDVLARANVLARSYRRRRRAAQATGASVLSAGIVAGSVALPALKWHHGSNPGVSVADQGVGNGLPTPSPVSSLLAAPSPTVSPSPTPTFSDTQALTEYFADGYDLTNATALASLWHETDLSVVKVKAGTMLLQGAALPVTPNSTPEAPLQKQQDQDINAFFAAGYDYNDALTLGQLWNDTDVVQVKADAGKKLLAGQTLPIQPSPTNSESAPPASAPAVDPEQERDLNAYFAAGYNYDDAMQLGKLWNQTDALQIKTLAGQKLLAGQTLPIAP